MTGQIAVTAQAIQHLGKVSTAPNPSSTILSTWEMTSCDHGDHQHHWLFTLTLSQTQPSTRLSSRKKSVVTIKMTPPYSDDPKIVNHFCKIICQPSSVYGQLC